MFTAFFYVVNKLKNVVAVAVWAVLSPTNATVEPFRNIGLH